MKPRFRRLLGAALLVAVLPPVQATPVECGSDLELRFHDTEFDQVWQATVGAAEAEFTSVAKSYEEGTIDAAFSRSSTAGGDTEGVWICLLHSDVAPGRILVRISQPGVPAVQMVGPNPAERVAARIRAAMSKPAPGSTADRKTPEYLPGPPR